MITCFIDIESWFKEDQLDNFTENIKAPKTYKDKEKIKEFVEKKQSDAKGSMMVDQDYARIKLISFKEEGKDAIIMNLTSFAAIMEEYRNEDIRLVTFNGSNYDLPIIIKQGIVNKLDLPYMELKQACGRYQKEFARIKHVDMMEVLGTYGQYKSLDKYMQIYLGTEKEPIDFLNCKEKELEDHAIADVVELEKLYNLFIPIIK